MKKVELLSPAGGSASMIAAVQCGADAVYLGAGEFNARRSAENFGGGLAEACSYCHARGVKVYVTLNTMVRQDEITRLEATIQDIARAGADGVIVQDLGTVRLIKSIVPALPLHASTQMAVHNPQGVEFLVRQGFTRVVLAREMEYREIERCRDLGADLEVFIHGALCVSCSGQCLMSSMIGGRSGNRGMCAQPCRMRYSLDGREGYLLSTRDLFGMEGLDELLEAGADSLKIEGRLKRPEYVAVTTRAYRKALDSLTAGQPIDLEAARTELAQMFNRGGFTRGYGFGAEESELMFRERPNHVGIQVGVCRKNGVLVPSETLNREDVLVLRRRGCEDIPVQAPDGVSSFSFPAARSGDQLFRSVSALQMADAHAAAEGEHRSRPIRMVLSMKVGSPVGLKVTDGDAEAYVSGETVQKAISRPADPVRIRAQLEKLGDTPFVSNGFDAEIDADAFLPVSALNSLRRQAVDKLLRNYNVRYDIRAAEAPHVVKSEPRIPVISVRSSSPAVLRNALAAGADRILFAPEDLRPDALEYAAEVLPDRFDLVLPPVTAENTLNTLNHWSIRHSDRIQRIILSNIGQFALSWPAPLAGDHMLNIANNHAVQTLTEFGLESYTPSVELNRSQIAALGGHKMLIVYGRLPLMQLRHCPLRAALNLNGRHRNCNRCDHANECDHINSKSLIDRTHAAFPLRRIATEDGCVIRLLNSAKLMLLRKAASLPAADEWCLMPEADDDLPELLRLHRAAAQGEDIRSDSFLKSSEGTTTGHYFRGAE